MAVPDQQFQDILDHIEASVKETITEELKKITPTSASPVDLTLLKEELLDALKQELTLFKQDLLADLMQALPQQTFVSHNGTSQQKPSSLWQWLNEKV